MSSLDDLIGRAKMLHSEGRSSSQIADEMSLSIETVTWLLTQQKGEQAAPKDILIDWSSISGHADMLRDVSVMLLKRFIHATEENAPDELPENLPDIIIGIAHSGIPLATMIAGEADCLFTMFHPKKHAAGDKPAGSLNSSFADVSGKRCLIVDDVITSGKTIKEAVDVVKKHGGIPIGICILFDKLGIREIDDVPVYSLVKVSRID
ncbi:MAG: orotate phosphoribosyltransferase-like protein [Methanomicrobiaceae archaeon]|nr:orotate phosphoribosyltransferase-like protein [Methanomicrobiaceae archaeon]